ncbi:hypothetical protein TRFO_29792 [Tritrichomonas foetus]|uniref:Uncharacterized protein n=1 Tax=Tritrichomonas foetus TaxID=1144522 RepID=A0A1J4JWY0_9EUKA|nr:hypothetical protein TRFO_29792 [Tritrichomonas foetus]|eukprot:OHT02968.1 hypothetical protein TRFO_29792 [Tritrichomonas foetus]
MNNKTRIFRKHGLALNEEQLETDFDADLSSSVIEMLNNKTVDHLSHEIEELTHKLNEINDEQNYLSKKSHNLEKLIKSQQQCISLLNHDNQILKEEVELRIKNDRKHSRKSKRIKESLLFNQIHQSINIQHLITKNSLNISSKNKESLKMNNIRIENYDISRSFWYNFHHIQQRRTRIMNKFSCYQNDFENSETRQKIIKQINDLQLENKKLNDMFREKEETKKEFEHYQKKLQKIDSRNSEIFIIEEETKQIQDQIEEERMKLGFNAIYFIDGQDTQLSQQFNLPFRSTAVQTDFPYSLLSEKEIKDAIIKMDEKINSTKEKMMFQKTESVSILCTLRSQCSEICSAFDMLYQEILNKK